MSVYPRALVLNVFDIVFRTVFGVCIPESDVLERVWYRFWSCFTIVYAKRSLKRPCRVKTIPCFERNYLYVV